MSSPIHGLMGTWHIAYSTLSFWKQGGRRNGQLEYTDLSDTGAASWTDTTVYDQPAWFSSACKQQKIVGTDTVLSNNPLQFQWRGAGLLRFLHSDCKVIASDPECASYAVVHFGPTLFTEAGVDVLCRQQGGITDELLASILAALDPETRAFVAAHDLRKMAV